MADRRTIEDARLRVAELLRLGLIEAAAETCREWAALAPADQEVWQLLGTLALQRGSPQEAEAALRRALELNDQSAIALSRMAVALQQQGRAGEGEGFARKAVSLEPANAAHWGNLGACLFDQRRWSDAVQAFEQAVSREPGSAACWSNLGTAEQRMGRLRDAQQSLERSLEIQPGQPNVLTDYASVLAGLGQPEQALETLQQVLACFPQAAPAWLAAGSAYQMLDQFQPALAVLRRAFELAPQQFEVRHNLALILAQHNILAEAEDLARLNTTEHPAAGEAWWLLGVILERQGRTAEVLAALARAVELTPNSEYHRSLLMSSQYADGVTPKSLLAAHREWSAKYAEPPPPPQSARAERALDRPLRIGFVSADFGIHPTGFLGLPVIEHLDKSQCQVVCYSDCVREDALTARFRAAASTWRQAFGLANEELAELIRQDEIDVLVDLMGHTGHERLLLFARQPAPMQITWLGYVGTTGMSAMNFLLADRFHIRPDEEAFYTERILRMPHGYACYGPPEDAPGVTPLPADESGRVTFGCFNNPAKLSPGILNAWASILKRVPDSQLLLKYGGLNDPRVRERLLVHFASQRIACDRILLEGFSPHRELLAAYGRVDVALDTQPYSGGLTTCEALWMGAPVITWPGKTFAGRHAASHLTGAGYPQFVAPDREGYIELAVEWAGRLEELAEVRARMRAQVRQSPLCDAPRFAKDFLHVVQEAWRLMTNERQTC
jgi:predicted O-linked N-acetylglucosamine transferase (SPINDLY family)